jgi:hypothetical protein
MFFPGKPHAGDTGNYGDTFQQAGLPHPIDKLLPDLLHDGVKNQG